MAGLVTFIAATASERTTKRGLEFDPTHYPGLVFILAADLYYGMRHNILFGFER